MFKAFHFHSSALFLLYFAIFTLYSDPQNKGQLHVAGSQIVSNYEKTVIYSSLSQPHTFSPPLPILQLQEMMPSLEPNLIPFSKKSILMYLPTFLCLSYGLQLVLSMFSKCLTLSLILFMLLNYFLSRSLPYRNSVMLEVG